MIRQHVKISVKELFNDSEISYECCLFHCLLNESNGNYCMYFLKHQFLITCVLDIDELIDYSLLHNKRESLKINITC